MNSDKPTKSLAIAYNVKKHNKKAYGGMPKAKPMAKGGEASRTDSLSSKFDKILSEHDHSEVMEHMAGRLKMYNGGEVAREHINEDWSEDSDAAPMGMHQDAPDSDLGGMDEDFPSISDTIMSKRKKFAEGGEVDLSENADEEPNHEDDDSFMALKKENYSESEGLDATDQPEDSNETGDEREERSENKRDVVDSIRGKMRKKNPGKSYFPR